MLNLDVDKAIAERDAELAQYEPFRFVFGGEHYELVPVRDVIVERMLREGRTIEGLERFFGAEQWERINQSSTLLSFDVLREILAEFGKYVDAPRRRRKRKPAKRTTKRAPAKRR